MKEVPSMVLYIVGGRVQCACATSNSYLAITCECLQCANVLGTTTYAILYMLSYLILTSDLRDKHYFLNIEEKTQVRSSLLIINY